MLNPSFHKQKEGVNFKEICLRVDKREMEKVIAINNSNSVVCFVTPTVLHTVLACTLERTRDRIAIFLDTAGSTRAAREPHL